jgi:heme exporter protein D
MIEAITQFLFMGGYAVYVWLAYGMLFLVLGINFTLAFTRQRRLRNQLSLQQLIIESHHES